METIDNYLQIMIDSLKKKDEYLDRILVKNQAQSDCIKGKEYEDVDWTAFNVLVAEKDTLINRITEIDDGFQEVYDRIKDEVTTNKDKYRGKLSELQKIITELIDKGTKIQTGEERNKQLIENIFLKTRKEIRKQRTGLNVANSYYKTMTGSVIRAAENSILDEKK